MIQQQQLIKESGLGNSSKVSERYKRTDVHLFKNQILLVCSLRHGTFYIASLSLAKIYTRLKSLELEICPIYMPAVRVNKYSQIAAFFIASRRMRLFPISGLFRQTSSCLLSEELPSCHHCLVSSSFHKTGLCFF